MTSSPRWFRRRAFPNARPLPARHDREAARFEARGDLFVETDHTGRPLDTGDQLDDELAGTTPAEDVPPAASAVKADWIAYAEAHGIDNADELTKAELVDQLGR